MDAGFEARLRVGDVTFDAADAALLRAVDEHGSLNAAATDLGRSYSRSHARITDLEERFGPLIERQRGGSGGGGSTLTPDARALLERFERLRAALAGTAEAEEIVLDGRVVDRDGELAVVETAAGTVRALVPAEGERVQVVLRADAVTLHTPDDAPPASGTSARNRFEGHVTAIDRGVAVARVLVDVGGEHSLAVLVTCSSVETLDLAASDRVIASFKATAARGIPRE